MRTLKKAVLPAVAMAALLTGLTTAKAWDQQATGAAMDYELSQRAAGADYGSSNARYFDQAPREGRGFLRSHTR